MFFGSRNPFLGLFFRFDQSYVKKGSKLPFFRVKTVKIWNISKIDENTFEKYYTIIDYVQFSSVEV